MGEKYGFLIALHYFKPQDSSMRYSREFLISNAGIGAKQLSFLILNFAES